MNCGECNGVKTIKRHKEDIPCPKCKATGESTPAKDAAGVDITPGVLARIIPQAFNPPLYDAKGNERFMPGYTGKVRCVYESTKGIVVELMALPNVMSSGLHTSNHGYRSARPSQIKVMRDTQQLRRLRKVKDKKDAG